MKRILLLAAVVLAFIPAIGQSINGRGGEVTRAHFTHDGLPLFIEHLDSAGGTISFISYAYPEGCVNPSQVTRYSNANNWERVSYGYRNGRLVSVAKYGPKGLRDSVWAADADTVAGAVRRALYIALPKAPDPLLEWNRAVEASRHIASDSNIWPDPLDGGIFLFDEEGSFLSRVGSYYSEDGILMWRGIGREPQSFHFADSGYDPRTVNTYSKAIFVADEYVSDCMIRSGARGRKHRNILAGSWFLLKNSGYGGALDFAVRPCYNVLPEGFYLTVTAEEGNVAHNNFNFGNFLWGASAREAGVPLWLARLGAHINNFLLSPDSRWTSDSPDDQFSICAGHHWR